MAQKEVLVGSPPHMAQFTALMTILLAFFILMNTLASKDRESGFEAGIGSIKNAFGAGGGMGFFRFVEWGKGGKHAPNPKNVGKADGLSRDLVERDGGSGNTDVSAKKINQGKYVRIAIPIKFPPKSSKLTNKMKNYLKQVGLGFGAIFDYKINIQCYTSEYKNKNGRLDHYRNKRLAIIRAMNIMEYLAKKGGVPYSKMQATGTTSKQYMQLKGQEIKNQAAFFYMFIKHSKLDN